MDASLRSAVELADELSGKASVSETDDPKDQKEYTFQFRFTDDRGKVWSGEFTNRILTIGDRGRVSVIKAKLSGGVPVAAIDLDTWEINEMLAHLAVSLDRAPGKIPEWARSLEDLYDVEIVRALYEEVISHEARFHGRGSDPSVGRQSEEHGDGAA